LKNKCVHKWIYSLEYVICEKIRLTSFACVLFFSSAFGLEAQTEYFVKVISDSEDKESVPYFRRNHQYDSLKILQIVQNKAVEMKSNGFVLSGVDSIFFHEDSCIVYWYVGKKYRIAKIHTDDKLENIIRLTGMHNYNYSSKNVDSNNIENYVGEIISFYTENGYPFAKIGFDSIRFNEDLVEMRMWSDPGKIITFDTLVNNGTLLISRNYLQRFLGIRPGFPYKHSLVMNMKKVIGNLQFAQLKEDPILTFVNDQCVINLNLEEKNASQFDFIIGVLPNTVGGTRRFLITGDISANLQNKLGAGEQIALLFRRMQADDQELRLSATYPYMLNSAFGADFLFELRRNRNLSVDLNTNIGGQYIIDGSSFLRVFWNFRSSRLTQIDTVALINRRRLPANLDFNYRGGGVQYNRQRLDYIFNPLSGWEFSVGLHSGLRSIVRNNSILSIITETVDFSQAYDTLKLNTFQVGLQGVFSYYKPLTGRITWKNGVTIGARYDDGKVLENEMYRIGGNRLLRGFDELSILTNYYGVFSTELRLLLDRNSYFTLPFIDISQNRLLGENGQFWDTAVGIGMGLNFATAAGIFNVSFAAGSRLGNPVNFQDTKVHFGYVNLF
jgi:outer membrane protein assembly factor BamA